MRCNKQTTPSDLVIRASRNKLLTALIDLVIVIIAGAAIAVILYLFFS